jgi:hypothetical protein
MTSETGARVTRSPSAAAANRGSTSASAKTGWVATLHVAVAAGGAEGASRAARR